MKADHMVFLVMGRFVGFEKQYAFSFGCKGVMNIGMIEKRRNDLLPFSHHERGFHSSLIQETGICKILAHFRKVVNMPVDCLQGIRFDV